MAAEWYYTRDRQQMGPVAWSELVDLAESGQLRPNDLVWRDGMPDWAPARSQGLFADRAMEVSSRRRQVRAERGLADDDEPSPRRRRRDDDEFDPDVERRPPRRHAKEGMPTALKVSLIAGAFILALVAVVVTLVLVTNSTSTRHNVPPQGLVFNDALVFTDAHDRRMGNACKVYSVHFVANNTYVIDHRSNAFDAYLRLEDPHGRVVMEDDDSGRFAGGGPLDARIVYRAPESGTYRIIATSLDGGFGNYTLTVRLDDPIKLR